MSPTTENPRLILGLKLRRLRHASGKTLRELAAESGLSISYLSEIEKGKKYPKPEKMMALANTLGLPFDELVSLQVTDELSALKGALSSPLLSEFPFDLFGFDAGDVLNLVNSDPARAGALVHALVEVGQSFALDTESFLLAALRAYQQMSSNYFEDLETAASGFRRERGWAPGAPVAPDDLESILVQEHGYTIDYEGIGTQPDLKGMRSVYREGPKPLLYVNGELMPSQRAFVLARELGYRLLGLEERALTSSWLRVESFDQVLNNFKASYFAGALHIDSDTARRDMAELFAQSTWQPDLLLTAMSRFDATPETYFTRLTQIVPKHFGLDDAYFLRMTTMPDGEVKLTKHLNTSSLPLALGLGLSEHHCRRWPSLQLLMSGGVRQPLVRAQRSRFLDSGREFFVVSTARPLALDRHRASSVTLAWRLDARFRKTVRFWNDPEVPTRDVNLTCERCPLLEEDCSERAAPATMPARRQSRQAKEAALAALDNSRIARPT